MKKVTVRMTGDFTVTCDDVKVEFVSNVSSKAVQLLMMLMYFHNEGISKSTLIENLYPNNYEVDTSNSLKALIFRLRKQLANTNIESNEYVVYNDGFYRFDPEIDYESDIDIFKRNIRFGNGCIDVEEAIPYYITAVKNYHGSLLPMLDNDMWIMVERTSMEEQFGRCIRKIAGYYRSNGNYDEANSYYKLARAILPYDDEWTIGYLECLGQQGKFDEVSQIYDDYKRMIFENLGIYPSETLREAYRLVISKNRFGEISAADIIEELKSVKQEGAYYCSFTTFANNYHLLRRIIEREHLCSTLLLCGIVDKMGHLISDYQQVKEQSDIVEKALVKTLRKSDVVTRYGKAQMLVLLWNTDSSNADIVIRRINENYGKNNTDKSIELRFIIVDQSKINLE